MNPEKFKEWLIKIDNSNIEKPAYNAHLNRLSGQIKQLSVQVHHFLKQKDRGMTSLQDQLNKKTSELFLVQSKSKQKLGELRRRIQKQKEIKQLEVKQELKQVGEMCVKIGRKEKHLNEQLKKKNRQYLQILGRELEKLRSVRSSLGQCKEGRKRNYQRWMERSMNMADKIIQGQEKDLLLVEEYERELMNRCDAVEKQLIQKLEGEASLSSQRQKLLFQKIELLIADVDID